MDKERFEGFPDHKSGEENNPNDQKALEVLRQHPDFFNPLMEYLNGTITSEEYLRIVTDNINSKEKNGGS